MIDKLKSWVLGLVKSQVTNNLGMLDALLTSELTALLSTKAKLPQDQAAALAADVTAILKTAITNLLAKI